MYTLEGVELRSDARFASIMMRIRGHGRRRRVAAHAGARRP